MGETEDKISLFDHFAFVSSCVLIIVGEYFIQDPMLEQPGAP